jgi:stage V sporulation protein G
MEITEVRIFLKYTADKKLKAYATVTFDNCFVVRDIKVIEGDRGLFVAMPSRKLRDACPKCGHGNPVNSRYCSGCGTLLEHEPKSNLQDNAQRLSQHKDIAHPITVECREYIQRKVLEAYERERTREKVVA